MKKNDINKLINKKAISKIPPSATQLRSPSIDYDKENPVFSFRHVCSNNCLLSNWSSSEISQLINKLKLFEQMSWGEVKTHRGINYKPIDNYVLTLPSSVPKDSVIHEFKVDDKKRLFGFRDGKTFCFIWFDRKHEVVPMNKSKAKH